MVEYAPANVTKNPKDSAGGLSFNSGLGDPLVFLPPFFLLLNSQGWFNYMAVKMHIYSAATFFSFSKPLFRLFG
jgi:hypothetical protein